MPPGWTLPALDTFDQVWFTSATLAVQACAACGTRQHPPEEVCHHCGGTAFDHDVLAPTGTVHSYTVAHYAAHPALADAVPYAIVLVALDDDPSIRVLGNLVDGDPRAVRIGDQVEAVWESRRDDDGEVLLPQWRPRT